MAKNILFVFLATTIVHLGSFGYNIRFQSNVTSGKAYLTYYFYSGSTVVDSGMVNKEGVVIFAKKDKLEKGIYAIFYGNNRFSSDFLIDTTQRFSVKADTNNISKTVITGSAENVLFESYQNFIAEKGKALNDARTAYSAASNKADSLKFEKEYAQLTGAIDAYRQNIMRTQPTSMMSQLLKAMSPPAVPQAEPSTRQDSLDRYYAYKAHYWDNISFTDSWVTRTPFFTSKLENYYREVMPQAEADTIIKDIDYKLLLARTSPEMYKFLLNWFTDEYYTAKYMGQDAVFVHLFEKYHSKGLSPWLNEKQNKSVSDRAYMQMSNLIGHPAENITMLDKDKNAVNLYDVNAKYTLMLFWDPTCGHCKTELPRIDSIYRASWKDMGLKIFSVLNDTLSPGWQEYIETHHLQDWTNVYQSKELKEAEKASQRPGYRQLFDVTMTPTILLLDDKKRIIAKKLSWEQIGDLLKVRTEREKG